MKKIALQVCTSVVLSLLSWHSSAVAQVPQVSGILPDRTNLITDPPVNTPVPAPSIDPGETIEPPVEVGPAPQIARFTVWIDAIDKELFDGPPEEAPERLYKHKAREKIFNIQALGRIYKDLDPAFDEMHEKFKDLEDGIGEYQKWADYESQGIAANESPEILEKLRLHKEAGRRILVSVLTKENFLPTREGAEPYTTQFRRFLANYAWPDVSTDRDFVLKKLMKELDKVQSAQYDFAYLEAGNGVHEFRRKLRWISMEARGLNGVITLKPKDTPCPVEHWSNLVNEGIASTKYAVLPPSPTEPNPVTLTPCLYIKVARLVEDVNAIKTKFEVLETFSEAKPTDLVDEPERLRAEAMLDDALTHKLFERLKAELALGLSTSSQM